jgi:hypothetical protein
MYPKHFGLLQFLLQKSTRKFIINFQKSNIRVFFFIFIIDHESSQSKKKEKADKKYVQHHI